MMKKKTIIPAVIILLIISVCILGSILSTSGPDEMFLDNRNSLPTGAHIFGTDTLGRDIFVRVCEGGCTSLFVSFICTIVTTFIGCLYGGLSALIDYLDKPLMAILDVLTSIPDVLVVLLLSIIFRCQSIFAVCLIICFLGWCKMAKLSRDLLKPLRNENYIVQARLCKKNSLFITLHHMIPNIAPMIVSRAVLSFSSFMFYESFLSYLGIGLQPPKTSWGNLISASQNGFAAHPYQAFFYCVLLFCTMLAVNCLGEALREPDQKDCYEIEGINVDLRQNKVAPRFVDHRATILQVNNLTITYQGDLNPVVNCVSFFVKEGEIVGLIGESGCGKTTLAKGISGLLCLAEERVKISGSIEFCNSEVDFNKGNWKLSTLGHHGIAIIHQDSLASLDPTMTVGNQFYEIIYFSGIKNKTAQKKKIADYLGMVGLGNDVDRIIKQYPYQLSGGIAQRIVIAFALALEPKLLICDEITSSLDVVNQKRIIELLKRINESSQLPIIFISHDMKCIQNIATRTLVMSRGMLKEIDKLPEKILPARKIFKDRHTQHTKIRIEHLYAGYTSSSDILKDISFKIQPGETFGVLGESGSGKTTLAKALVRLFADKQYPIRVRISNSLESEKKNVQYIYQNPVSSFDPHWKLRKSLTEGIQDEQELLSLLSCVGLSDDILEKLPSELSIGQCQRAAIARALLQKPDLLICDEPTSSMDVMHQKDILELLRRLIDDNGITCVFISHDIDVLFSIADRMAVMYKGKIVEIAPAPEFYHPSLHHPYTECLLTETIMNDNSEFGESDSCCAFYHACNYRDKRCAVSQPSLKKVGVQTLEDRHHFIACTVLEQKGGFV